MNDLIERSMSHVRTALASFVILTWALEFSFRWDDIQGQLEDELARGWGIMFAYIFGDCLITVR